MVTLPSAALRCALDPLFFGLDKHVLISVLEDEKRDVSEQLEEEEEEEGFHQVDSG